MPPLERGLLFGKMREQLIDWRWGADVKKKGTSGQREAKLALEGRCRSGRRTRDLDMSSGTSTVDPPSSPQSCLLFALGDALNR